MLGLARRIHAANAAALRLGLYPGLALAEAQARVPDLRVADAEPEADAAGLARLAAWCLRLSPLAAPSAPDGVWIDITGCAHLHEGEAALLQRLLDRLAEAGIAARAAVADTPGCAHAVARFGLDVAAIVPPGETRAALLPLPVAALRLPEDVVARLRHLGIETVADVAALPRGPLARRLGAAVLTRLDQALGRVAEPIEPVLPKELCRVRQGFAEPISTAEDLARVAGLLGERLAEKLVSRGEGAARLDLVMTRVDGTAQTLRVGLSAPSREAAHFSRLLLPLVERIDPGFGVEQVMLSASLTAPLGARQMRAALLAHEQPGAELSALIDTLLNRLGARNLFRVGAVESDVPERSLRALPPVGEAPAEWPADLPRPTRLIDPPQRVEAMALLPDHPPVQFTWRARPHRVRRADGPERIHGEWWRAEEETWAVRDYFQVEDEAGQRFWLFREGDGSDPETGAMGWYLHGVFG